MAYVTEAGMYSLILRSRKPEAKAFKRWIIHTVLPEIRKTGSYNVTAAPAIDLTTIAGLDVIFAAGQAALEGMRAEAARADHAEERLEIVEEQLAIDAPKIDAYDAFFEEAEGDFDVAMAAKMLDLGLGRGGLFDWLRDHDWLQLDDQPLQTKIKAKLLASKAYKPYTAKSGRTYLSPPQVRVTAKGLDKIRREMLAEAQAARRAGFKALLAPRQDDDDELFSPTVPAKRSRRSLCP